MKIKIKVRKCPHCKGDFTPIRGQRHCSINCALWSRVDIRGEDECWPWTGKDFNRKGGYGQFSFRGRRYRVHRTVLRLTKGLPDGKSALHSCDDPKCANPNHLRAGTQLENIMDMVSRNRVVSLSGENHPRAILKNSQVIEIRKRLMMGKRHADIAKEIGIDYRVISRIKNGKAYKYVTESAVAA